MFDDFDAGDDIKAPGRKHSQLVAVIKFKTLSLQVPTKRALVKTRGMNLQVSLLREKSEESPVAAPIVQPLQRLWSPSSFELAHELDEIVELEESWCLEWISEFLLVIDDGIHAPTPIVVGGVEACGVDHGAHKLKGAIEALEQLENLLIDRCTWLQTQFDLVRRATRFPWWPSEV